MQKLKIPSKPGGKGRGKSALARSVTQDIENLAAENSEAGKEHDEPLTVSSKETPQPDDPAIESQFYRRKLKYSPAEMQENADRPYRDQH